MLLGFFKVALQIFKYIKSSECYQIHILESLKIVFLNYLTGMLPSKTMRGRRALRLLKAYEGIPGIYQHTVRKVVPDALRKLRLAPGRKVRWIISKYWGLGFLLTKDL